MKKILVAAIVLVMTIGIIGCGKSDKSPVDANKETRQLVVTNQETEETSDGMEAGYEQEGSENAEGLNLEDYDLFRYFAKPSAEVALLSGIEPETMENGTQHFELSKSVTVYTDASDEHKIDYLNISAYNNTSPYHIGKYWLGMSREDIDRVSEEVGYHWLNEENKIVRFTNDIHIIQFYLDNSAPARATQISLYWYE